MVEDRYVVVSGAIVDGSYLVVLQADFDSDTGDRYVDEDGSALPSLLLRIDPATGEIDNTVEIGPNSSVGVLGGRAILRDFPDAVTKTSDDGTSTYRLGEAVYMVVDPATLRTEAIEEDLDCLTSGTWGTLATDELQWRTSMEGISATTLDDCQIMVNATLSTVDGAEDSEKVGMSQFALSADGDDVLVLRTYSNTEDFDAPPVAVALDRVSWK